jgi:hypothetical protein
MSNYKIHPEQEYLMLQNYYKTGDGSQMPDELLRLETIYHFIQPLLDKGFLKQQQIANLLYSEFKKRDSESPSDATKFNITRKTSWNHVTNARKYYFESQEENPSIHRLRLTKLLYKQIAIIQEVLSEQPVKAEKIIMELADKIAKLNKCYDSDRENINSSKGEIYFLLSDNTKEFPDILEVSDDELYKLIDKFTISHELTDEQKSKIIRKDVRGELT